MAEYKFWKDAIVRVLGDADKALTINDIDGAISANGYYSSTAKDAKGRKDTINSTLTRGDKKDHLFVQIKSSTELDKYKLSSVGQECYDNDPLRSPMTNGEVSESLRDIKPFANSENKQEIKIGDLNVVDMLIKNHNIILHGAPGTGKTYLAQKIAEAMDATKENDQFKMVQFHPSYDYTDFVEGLRPMGKDIDGGILFDRRDGVFKTFCKEAVKHYDSKKYVFLIDEINRGDMSKIFGELFFSIDPGYRVKKGKENEAIMITTQYQNLIDKNGTDPFKDDFYIPDNVYIIGTMNDIDRSVESMDFAMRRRFQFIEVKPEHRADDMGVKKGSEARKRMTNLNNCISGKVEDGGIGLSAAYHIGPSYFMKLAKGEESVIDLWNYRLEGLLREYLRGYDDADSKIEKLKKVFNDTSVKTQKTDSTQQYEGAESAENSNEENA